jgi:hypothetical protein
MTGAAEDARVAEEEETAAVEKEEGIGTIAEAVEGEITRINFAKTMYLCQTFFKNKTCYSLNDRNTASNRRAETGGLPSREAPFLLVLMP